MTRDIISWTGEELSDAIVKRRVSCREVMEAYIRRIDDVNVKVNAIVQLRPTDELLMEAERRDEELGRGIHRGWMHGFPHAVKDLISVKGMRTTYGSPLFEKNLVNYDDVLVDRMRSSGAIFIGKTNVPEFGLGSNTYNKIYGSTLNAYDATLTAGGSSGGAAVAVATHMVPVADGSDTMGSLRNPAAYNRIYSFRPTLGLIPDGPGKDVFLNQISMKGPMARTVEDLCRLLEVMGGQDGRYPLSRGVRPLNMMDDLESEMSGRRIAWFGDLDGYLCVEDGILEQCVRGLGILEDAGCRVSVHRLEAPLQSIWKAWLNLRSASFAAAYNRMYEDKNVRNDMKPEMIWEIERGRSLSALDYFEASRVRTSWAELLDDIFEQYDYIALPSAQVYPFKSSIEWPHEIGGKTMDTYHRWMEVTIYASIAGCPVVNIPLNSKPGEGSMGLQLIGPRNHDTEVLRLARSYERSVVGMNLQ